MTARNIIIYLFIVKSLLLNYPSAKKAPLPTSTRGTYMIGLQRINGSNTPQFNGYQSSDIIDYQPFKCHAPLCKRTGEWLKDREMPGEGQGEEQGEEQGEGQEEKPEGGKFKGVKGGQGGGPERGKS
ncbi:MAG: hypothetical protein J6V81_06230, partial [Bacteroidales bacterium]|nr:hypothetical protein [Bacteroidales bacterium]